MKMFEHVEAAGGGGDEGGLLEGGGAESWGPRGGDPGPVREDRGVDGGAGFLAKGLKW